MRIRPSGSRQDRRLSPLPHIILCETPEEFERTGYGGGGGRTQRLRRVGVHNCAYLLERFSWLTRHSHWLSFLNYLSLEAALMSEGVPLPGTLRGRCCRS